MDFAEKMTSVISKVVGLKDSYIEYGGWLSIMTVGEFKSEVHIYKLYKDKKRRFSLDEYYNLLRKIYGNLEYIGSRLNVVFNFFAYDRARPLIAFGIGDDILHDEDILYIGNILYAAGFSRDITIIDTIRNIGYNVMINR